MFIKLVYRRKAQTTTMTSCANILKWCLLLNVIVTG